MSVKTLNSNKSLPGCILFCKSQAKGLDSYACHSWSKVLNQVPQQTFVHDRRGVGSCRLRLNILSIGSSMCVNTHD